MEHKRLTISLPVDVWDRLAAEAADQNPPVKIGTHLRNLILARDDKKR